MGRNTGLASGADVILIPDIPFNLEAIVSKIKERSTCGSKSTIICVAEGAAPIGGKRVTREFVPDSAEPIRLGGIAEWLDKELKGLLRQLIYPHPMTQ